MSQMFNSEFQKSMDTLHFSSEAKEQLRARLVQQLSESKKREVKTMHKTYRKGLIVAAACLMITGGTHLRCSRQLCPEVPFARSPCDLRHQSGGRTW